jgi:hypothetical protein
MSSITVYPCRPININYLGSFAVPSQSLINYTWGECAYDSDTQQFYISGAYNQPQIGVYSKPQVGVTLTNAKWFDPTFGNWNPIATSGSGQGARHRGFLAGQGGLWMHTTPFYTVTGSSTYVSTIGYTNGSSFNGWAKASIHQLQTTGPVFNIPESLRSSFGGCDTGCFNQDQQGGSLTNWGPALYVYNRQTNYTQDQNISITKIFDCVGQNSPNVYPDWWPDRKLTSALMTDKYYVIGYSKSIGARWYGNYGHGLNGYGRNWNETTAVPDHDIQSIINPGTLATDGTSGQGFHAESFHSFLLIAAIDTVIAGKPVWYEVDLSSLGVNYSSGEFRITYNPVDNLIYGMERNGGKGGAIPKGHILQIT